MILIDEAYHDYVTIPSYHTAVDIALATPNVFVTRTFSKAYGMAGLRAGYAIGQAPTVKSLQALKTPYTLGTVTLGGALVALGNDPHIASERARNTEVKAFTVKAFADMGITGTDSQTNFLFMDIKRPAAGFRDACRAEGVLVGRDFPPFEKRYCRISIGTMAEMQQRRRGVQEGARQRHHHGRAGAVVRCPESRRLRPCRSRDVRSFRRWASARPACGSPRVGARDWPSRRASSRCRAPTPSVILSSNENPSAATRTYWRR